MDKRDSTYHYKKFRGFGADNPNWKGGRYIKAGYWLVRDSSAGAYVQEHRLVWEETHKACLLPWGHVHHIDGNKQNNDPQNLLGMSHSQHLTLERTGKRHTEETKRKMSLSATRDMSQRRCADCESATTQNTHGRPNWYRCPTGDGFLCRVCYKRQRRRTSKDSLTKPSYGT